LHPELVGEPIALLIDLPIGKLDMFCNDSSKTLTFRKSCAAETGRRVYQTLAIKRISGISDLSIPSLSSEAKN
jgi:hypothetical protein